MDIKEYYNVKENKLVENSYLFILLRNVISRVFVTNDNHQLCPKCDNSLMIVDAKLKIYEDIQQSNIVERRECVDLFYCKNCKRYYVTPPIRKQLEKNLGNIKSIFNNSVFSENNYYL